MQDALFSKDLLVQAEPSLLLELHDAEGAELFGNAGHAEEMVGRGAYLVGFVGKSVAAGILHLGTLHNGNRYSRDMEVVHELINLGVDIGNAVFDQHHVIGRAVAGFRNNLDSLDIARKIISSTLGVGLAVDEDTGALGAEDFRHQTGPVHTFRHGDAVVVVGQHGSGSAVAHGRIVVRSEGKTLKRSLVAHVGLLNDFGSLAGRQGKKESRDKRPCG